MTKYIVQGGHPLFGEVEISGAKNAAVLAAQILAVEDEALARRLALEGPTRHRPSGRRTGKVSL